uniref:Receptor for retinol uptake STRA6 n=1 Tax=Octopus bimaculoides TaxID=37653 RepID=A0A0L8GRC4_OCTBM
MQITTTTTSLLILSITIITTLASLKVDAKELGHNCTTTISPNVSKSLNRLVKSGRKVFNFEVHVSDKRLDDFLKPVPLNYFANARHFSWIPNKPDGLNAYKNVPYDFPLYSLNLLDAYIATPSINIDINCAKQNIRRYDVIHLIFEELKRIVFTDELQMGESGYMCFFISLLHEVKKNSPYAFLAYRRLGMNRKILKNYCCELHKNESYVYQAKSICSGNIIDNSSFNNYANIVGAILWAFSPLFIRFTSKAEIPSYSHQFNLVQFAHDEFLFRIKYTLPNKSEWINEKHSIYSFSHFVSWLFCFHHSTFFASRLRRFILILFSLSVIFLCILMHYFFLYETVTILVQDRIPLGYRALILGISESYENTDGFLGGPLVCVIGYIFLSCIVFILPSRLSETIAYSTLHQRSTCTFLIQNIKLLNNYGNLNVSTLQNYDLLYAIMKANISTALNPNFWCLIIYTWIKRLQKIWFYYYERNIFSQFILLWIYIAITILFAVFSICELLLCLVYYGIPTVYLIFTLPLSYFKVYIFPLYVKNNYFFMIIAVIVSFLSFPFFTLWVLYSSYVFLMSFQIICRYIFSIAIAMLAKPDAVGDVWFVAMFFFYGSAVMSTILKQYHTILLETIKLTKTLRPSLVQSKYGEEFINAKLFKVIVNNHYPLRHEIGKSIVKLFLVVSFFFACNNIISQHDLDLSASTKIALLLMTTMIPKSLSIINTKFHFDIFLSSEIIDTINVFEE